MRGGRSYLGRGGLGWIKRQRGWGGGGWGTGAAAQSVHGNYTSLKEINVTAFERMQQFILGGRGGAGGAAQVLRGNLIFFL